MNETRPDFTLNFSYPTNLKKAMDDAGICPRPNWSFVIINALWEEVDRLRVIYGLRAYHRRKPNCQPRHCKQRKRMSIPGPRTRPGRRD